MFLKTLKLGVIASRLYTYRISHFRPLLTLQYNQNYNYKYYEQKRNYKNFGHKPDPAPRHTKYWYSVLVVLFILPWFDYNW